jgi:hypothetical protein
MQFLNPLVLIGLIAASIPVILHLLNLRKLKTIEFSTLRFLKELQKTKIRRLKLKQIILLILRTLIIIFAVLAFARPTIKSSLPFIGGTAKTSAVILLDNSFSMDVSDEGGNRFKQAKSVAHSIIDALKEGDEVALIDMAGIDKNISSLSRNFALIKEELSKTKISNVPANLETSMRLASNILDKSINLNKEVYIITDAQRNIFTNENKDSLKLFDKTTAVYFIPVGYKSKSDIQNLSIDSLTILTRIFQKDKPVEIESRIRNNSGKNIQGAIVSLFYNNERVAQRTMDINANETRTLTISAEPNQPGAVSAYLELEDDALNYDNKRFFGFIIPDKPKVAIIGKQDKSDYISTVYSSSGSEQLVKAKYYQPSEFAGVDLTNYDIVILAGGPYLKSDFNRLGQFVKNGGSCLVFADDLSGSDIFNYGMSLLGFGSVKELSYSEKQPSRFSSVDKMHPLFEGVFKGTSDSKSIVESPKIFKSLSNIQGQPLIEIPGGNFLSESRLGEGKVLYCSVSPVMSWSSFPVTGLFPALIYRSTFYLSSREGIGVNISAGNPLMLTIPGRYAAVKNFKITDPNRNEYFQQSVSLPNGAVLSLDKLNLFGNYIISSPQNNIVSIVSVNPLPSESYLKPIPNVELFKILKNRLSDPDNLRLIDDMRNVIQNVNRARTGSELWKLFIILAILCAVAEMLVARSTKKEALDLQ